MPIYDYACMKCEILEEHQVSFQDFDTAEIKCEKCGSIMERQMSRSVGIHFKGPGFYSTGG